MKSDLTIHSEDGDHQELDRYSMDSQLAHLKAWGSAMKVTPAESRQIGQAITEKMARSLPVNILSRELRMSQEFYETQAFANRMWGERATRAVEAARHLVREVEGRAPGLMDWLEDTGLGNSPQFLAVVVSAARRQGLWA